METKQHIISDRTFGGERPLFAEHDLRLERVTVGAGESALKEGARIEAEECRFEGKYPFWHVDGAVIRGCRFTPEARAALWYSRRLTLADTLVEAPKTLRELDDARLERVRIPQAQETLWHCRGVSLDDVEVAGADYIFFHCSGVDIRNYRQQGLYSFQYCRDVEIRDARIDSKDAFWNSENVTVYDSTLRGEYLGWYSRNLRLVRCRISGTQPLCYAEGLVLEHCTMADDCDRAFEGSDVRATIDSAVPSVTNPRTGSIEARAYGEVLLDAHVRQPADCRIITV